VFSGLMSPQTWTALFWIIIVFAVTNTVVHSFSHENDSRFFYYFTLSAPENIIMGKILYNNVLMVFLALLIYGIYALFLGSFISQHLLFVAVLILGAVGLSSLLTMTTAIARKAGGNFSLSAVLGFPLTLPLLLVLVKITNLSMVNHFSIEILKLLVTLFFLDIIIMVLAYILFPYIWRD